MQGIKLSSLKLLLIIISFNKSHSRIGLKQSQKIYEQQQQYPTSQVYVQFRENIILTKDWTTEEIEQPKRIPVYDNQEKEIRIVNGTKVSVMSYKNDYPFLCAALKATYMGEKIAMSHSCGCTLIAPNVALTAAHCAEHIDFVRIGHLYLDPNLNRELGLKEELIRVIKTVSHPEWNPDTFSYDVMLLKLETSSEKKVVKLKVTEENDHEDGNGYYDNEKEEEKKQELTVVGWGVTESTGSKASNRLKKAHLFEYEKRKCLDFYGEYLDDTMFCAYSSTGADTCQGDSGGPILQKCEVTGEFVQLGLVSWGASCGVYPGVYCDLGGNARIRKFIHHWVCSKKKGFSPDFCIKGKMPNFI